MTATGIGNSTRLNYDECSYKKQLNESVSPGNYKLSIDQTENVNRCRNKNDAIQNVKKSQSFDLSKGDVIFTGTDSLNEMVDYWPSNQPKPKRPEFYSFSEGEKNDLLIKSYHDYKKNSQVSFEQHLKQNAFSHVQQKKGPNLELGLHDDFTVGYLEKGSGKNDGIKQKVLSSVTKQDAEEMMQHIEYTLEH
jgi:hypothetical protein